MRQSVIDLGSNLNENLKRWSKSLARGGNKLKVFNVIYSVNKKQWTAKEISSALKGAIDEYDVSDVGRKLVGDGLLQRLDGSWPVVYVKIPEVQHYKNDILALVRNSQKRSALPTKQEPRSRVNVRVSGAPKSTGRAVEITVEDIDQFARVRKQKKKLALLPPLSEARFKRGLLKLFREDGKFPDSGVERDDFITNKLRMGKRRHSAAFALKGPGTKGKVLSPAKWGKRGNQIQKLVSAPATVFMLQAERQIDEDSLEQLQDFVELKSVRRHRTLYYGHIDRTDSLRLRHCYPEVF